MTAAEARAKCLAQGSPADACDEMIRNKTVGGVFCDGDVVAFVDASGHNAKRCVPAAVVDQKLALATIPPQPMSQNTKLALALGGIAVTIGVVYFLTR